MWLCKHCLALVALVISPHIHTDRWKAFISTTLKFSAYLGVQLHCWYAELFERHRDRCRRGLFSAEVDCIWEVNLSSLVTPRELLEALKGDPLLCKMSDDVINGRPTNVPKEFMPNFQLQSEFNVSNQYCIVCGMCAVIPESLRAWVLTMHIGGYQKQWQPTMDPTLLHLSSRNYCVRKGLSPDTSLQSSSQWWSKAV